MSQFIHGKPKSTLHNDRNSYSSDKSQSQWSNIFDLVDVSPMSAIFPKTCHISQQSLKSTYTDKIKANFNANFINKDRFQPTESNFEIIDSVDQYPEHGSVRETTKVICSAQKISCSKDDTKSINISKGSFEKKALQ